MSLRTWVEQKMTALIVRAVVSRVDDALAGQGLQVRALENEALEVEHRLPYGFTAVPLPPDVDARGAEAVVLFLGGSRSHGLAIAVSDRRHRLTGLTDGEVAIYDDLGQRVHLLRGKVLIQCDAGNVVEVGAGGVLTAVNGVVTGTALDPYTGLTQFVLGNASTVVRAES